MRVPTKSEVSWRVSKTCYSQVSCQTPQTVCDFTNLLEYEAVIRACFTSNAEPCISITSSGNTCWDWIACMRTRTDKRQPQDKLGPDQYWTRYSEDFRYHSISISTGWAHTIMAYRQLRRRGQRQTYVEHQMVGIPKRREEKLTSRFQIVYVSIMGTVMLAAFLEWFLWLAAFLYCLVKVYQKAEHWSIRLLAAVMMILFTALR